MTNDNINRELLNNKEWLYKKYVEEKLTTCQIAELCNCSRVTIGKQLKKFDIKIRSISKANNPNINWNLLDNKDWLYKKYVEEKLNTIQIAKLCNCTSSTVWNQLKKFDIKIRSISKANNPNINWNLLDNKDWLYKKYVEEKLTTCQIAELCNCSHVTIGKQLKKFDIEIRSRSESNNPDAKWNLLNDKEWLYKKYVEEKLNTIQIAELCNCGSTSVWNQLKKFNIEIRPLRDYINPNINWNLLDNKDWLYKKYVEEKLSTIKIADLCNCGDDLIGRQLRNFNIELRDNKKENNHFWKGGLTENPYCDRWTTSLKEKVRDKNDRICYLCGKTEEENGKKLSVHHIDYNKMQGCKSNEQSKRYRWNLKPLCASCHAKTNFNRYYWFNLLYNNWVFDNVEEDTLFIDIIFFPCL